MTTTTASSNMEQQQPKERSLLVQALAVPSLNASQQSEPSVETLLLRKQSSTNSSSREEPSISRHSDFTVPTSNISENGPPPMDLLASSPTRRSVFGGRVSQKYGSLIRTSQNNNNSLYDEDKSLNLETPPISMRSLSDLSPPTSPSDLVSPLQGTRDSPTTTTTSLSPQRAHETIHAQSLLLGLAFMAIWSPQNIMAPNLTEIANDFHFDATERDVYLGANVALATSVLSLPISAGIGILADVLNRKYLFCITVAVGGLCSLATGLSPTYKCLFWARLLNGGCMSGSVPVAFSLLGDLFHTHERNAASSGLTAMMGLGIIAGQVYAGVVGSTLGWPHAFYVSAAITGVSSLLVLLLVQEPERGGKERVLQEMISQGTRYERQLTWKGFLHAMRHNKSNSLLMWQGFFSSVPWGIIFVFLNDYLSQERGFSVPDATYIVLIFGLGCAAGGVLGGYWGQYFNQWDRRYLPLFMAATTVFGIFPFVGLLNGSFTNAHGFEAVLLSFMGGCIASLPSVNVRPCIINVNPPETRGAALTAANLIINLARGAGPSCITLMGAIWHTSRRVSFNVTLAFFWVVSAIQLVFLAKTLPKDQDAMEAELQMYAETRLREKEQEEESLVSLEERMTSFDAGAARESIKFMGEAIREISDEFRQLHESPLRQRSASSVEKLDLERRRRLWLEHQRDFDEQQKRSHSAHEATPLL